MNQSCTWNYFKSSKIKIAGAPLLFIYLGFWGQMDKPYSLQVYAQRQKSAYFLLSPDL